MFIVAPATSSAKLRRSGMNGSGDVVRAGSNTCRSYGAWPGVVGTTTYLTSRIPLEDPGAPGVNLMAVGRLSLQLVEGSGSG